MSDQIDDRPGLAIIINTITPYHVNLHLVVAAGIPEFKLHVLVTHGSADFNWQVDFPPDVAYSRFAVADESALDGLLRRPLSEWKKGGRLIRYIRENRIRAVILNGYRYVSFLRVMDYCCRSGIPFFVNNDSNIRSEPVLSPLARLGKQTIYKWWLKRATGVLSMGSLGDQFFIKYGANPDRLYRVPYWPDYDSFRHVDPDRLARFRQRFGLRDGRRYIMYSGRLVSYKRVDLLIDAFAAIADDRPNWDLLIVGDGVQREELHGCVPERLRNRVVWTGFLDRQEPALAYHSADVLVLPSDQEPWAVVVQEAMAAGMVVVSSDVSGAAFELVKDGHSGRIFPKGDLAKLKQALLDTTNPAALAIYKQGSAARLAGWRSEVNPVAEIRRALRDAGVLDRIPQRSNNH